MERMLVVLFDDEANADEGRKAIVQLDREGSMVVYGYAVIVKHANGTATVKQEDNYGPLGTLVGTSLGSVIGLLGGPTGIAIGAAAGLAVGGAVDWNNARIGDDFIADVTKVLSPNKVALVAEVDEDWTEPVDSRMEAIGGTVFRRALSAVSDTVDAEEIAAMTADFAQMQAELAQVHADRKARLHEKINELGSRIRMTVR